MVLVVHCYCSVGLPVFTFHFSRLNKSKSKHKYNQFCDAYFEIGKAQINIVYSWQILRCGDNFVSFNIIGYVTSTRIENYRKVTSKIDGENLTVEMTHFLYCDFLANTN